MLSSVLPLSMWVIDLSTFVLKNIAQFITGEIIQPLFEDPFATGSLLSKSD